MIDLKNRRGISGFTMAEMLIVVAIIAVLGGVGFVAVQNYQRSMAQLECDAIAKEIFVAAQNHLTMADSQGYLGLGSTSYGNKGTWSDDQDVFNRQQVYYFTVNGSSSFHDNPMLNMVLPFGSIDETVRLGGSYIIRYQPQMARVLDVFYTDPKGRYPYILDDDEDEYKKVMEYRKTNKTQRQKCTDLSNATLGWFGGDGVLKTGDYDIIAPEISVENAERLTVTVTNKNDSAAGVSIKLIVSSKNIRDNSDYAKIAFELTENPPTPRVSKSANGVEYTIILDDITRDETHFAELNDIVPTLANKFIPGEDIVVQAVAYSNSRLSNIAYSAEITVNSLFADLIDVVNESTDDSESDNSDGEAPEFAPLFSADGTSVKSSSLTMEETPADKTAVITHFRHLENLDESISGVKHDELHITQAKQVADLNWSSYSEEKIYYKDGDDYVTSDAGCYKPVNVDYLSLYNGGYTESEKSLSHSITGIKVEYDGNSGLFGTFDFDPDDGAEPAKITNLELINFEINASGGNAGALAGTLNHTTVSNVLAYHKNDSATISATNGDAGGLVGTMNGGQIEQCAAALYVQGGTNAGGLVGKVENTAITASYSGGHTKEGSYSDNIETDSAAVNGLVNVIGGTNAGGLIGAATGNTSIQYCYSTCSTYAKISGGLIGNASYGVTVAENYAAGRVLATAEEGASRGMFLGSGSLTLGSIEGKTVSNYYVSGINGTLGSGAGESVVKVFEMSKVTDKATTSPYDATLTGKYSYLTVAQLSGKTTDKSEPEHLKMHYGDWQEPVDLDAGLEIINAERLTARLSFNKDNLGDSQLLTMLIKGETSGQTAYLLFEAKEGAEKPTLSLLSKIPKSVAGATVAYYGNEEIGNWLNNVRSTLNTANGFISIDLDDITSKTGHFAQLFPTFIPGENIIVAAEGNEVSQREMEAIFTDNEGKLITLPVKSEDGMYVRANRTNSLFSETSVAAEKTTASIKNFRHLENLDRSVSNVAVDTLSLQNAIQTEDLVWENFCKTINAVTPSNVKVYYAEEATDAEGNITTTIQSTVGGCFKPVAVSYALNYNGQSTNADETIHSITGVKVDYDGHAGLFGSMVDRSSVSNLELIDFSVTGTGDAGALAGTLAGTNVTNVLAHNSTNATTVNVSATSGNAGGLIGSMTGGTVEKCAAALIVNAGDDTHVGNAGGLIGTVSNGTMVSASYSGGHTENAAYSSTNYNVTATGTAGGLIGIAGGAATISNSYSTCSATGATVGGFVGTSSGTIANCYATGLVSGTIKGAFAGSLSNATNCWYYEIINEGVSALPGESAIVIRAIDYNTASYNGFVDDPDTWNPANPYDTTLGTLFEGSYNLQTVDQLAKSTKAATSNEDIAANFAYTHYGDWPAPEMLVVNK